MEGSDRYEFASNGFLRDGSDRGDCGGACRADQCASQENVCRAVVRCPGQAFSAFSYFFCIQRVFLDRVWSGTDFGIAGGRTKCGCVKCIQERTVCGRISDRRNIRNRRFGITDGNIRWRGGGIAGWNVRCRNIRAAGNAVGWRSNRGRCSSLDAAAAPCGSWG